MNYSDKNGFRFAVKEYLSSLYIGFLRSYGRYVGVQNPTMKKKGELLDDILAVLTGEMLPVQPSNLGAPVKNHFVDPKIIEEIERLKKLYLLDYATEEGSFFTYGDPNAQYFSVNDSGAEYPSFQDKFNRKMYSGQIATVNSVSQLIPLNGEPNYQKLIIPIELIRKNDLREGDVITCYAEERPPVLCATEILSRNGLVSDSKPRRNFDEAAVVFPEEKLHFLSKDDSSILGKYLEWLLPLGKGRRGVIIAPPKAGKTVALKTALAGAKKANPNLCAYALLLEQSPECIAEYNRLLPSDNVFSTSYEDDAERHVFLADFILERAKRLAEKGEDVLIIVDSLTALMRAYNETEYSFGGKTFACGLESKTLHYIKKYLGSARCFEKGGSLTILGTLSVNTGNPADDFAFSEILSVCNHKIVLNGELAARRVFPAIDFFSSNTEQPECLLSEAERECEYLVRYSYLPKKSYVDLLLLLNQSATPEQFLANIKKGL